MADDTTGAAEIGGFQFLDFVASGPTRSHRLVVEQKGYYQAAHAPAWIYYNQLHAGLRQAALAADPRPVLDRVVARAADADAARGLAYREAADGFLELLPKGATATPVHKAKWRHDGLSVEMRRMVGLRQRNGRLLYVAPYVKNAPIGQDAASVLLYLMESVAAQALPGAVPQVWDLRRRQAFKLRGNANRTALGHHVRGRAVAYLYAWNQVA